MIFTYSVDLVVSRYKNELTKLTDVAGDFYQGSAYREKYLYKNPDRNAFPEFFGYIAEGIFQDQLKKLQLAKSIRGNTVPIINRDISNTRMLTGTDILMQLTGLISDHPILISLQV